MSVSTRTVDMREAQSKLPELVALAHRGTEVILTDGAKPIARLVPLAPTRTSRVAGLHPGAISTSEDFDAPLPEEFWLGSQ